MLKNSNTWKLNCHLSTPGNLPANPWELANPRSRTAAVRGQKIEEHVVTDLDARNDENRPGSSSGPGAAEESQEVSSKNTTDELSDAITGDKDIGLWSSNIAEKMREYWLKNEKLFLKHDVPQRRKGRNSSRKCTTNLIRRQKHNAEVVERIWLCFSPSQTYDYCFTCRLMCVVKTNVRISSLEKEEARWGITSNQWNIKMTPLRLAQM